MRVLSIIPSINYSLLLPRGRSLYPQFTVLLRVMSHLSTEMPTWFAGRPAGDATEETPVQRSKHGGRRDNIKQGYTMSFHGIFMSRGVSSGQTHPGPKHLSNIHTINSYCCPGWYRQYSLLPPPPPPRNPVSQETGEKSLAAKVHCTMRMHCESLSLIRTPTNLDISG